MVLGCATITFRLSDCHSLKEKRKIIKSVIARVRAHFNAAAAEVGLNDVHQRAVLGVAVVGNAQNIINSTLDKIIEFIENMHLAEIIDTHMEIMVL
jgi:uncharacterized protein